MILHYTCVNGSFNQYCKNNWGKGRTRMHIYTDKSPVTLILSGGLNQTENTGAGVIF